MSVIRSILYGLTNRLFQKVVKTMTTGSRVLDGRYNDFYNRKVLGPYFSKTWNGGDRSIGVAELTLKKIVSEARPKSWYSYKEEHSQYLFSDKQAKNIIARHHALYDRWVVELQRWKFSLKAYKEFKATQRARKGEQHPYTMSLVKSYTTPAFIARWDDLKNAPPNPESPLGFQISGPSLWTTSDDNATIEKFREKLTNIQGGFHAGVAIAELEKTLRMVADTAKTLRRFGQQMQKGNVPGALRVLYNGRHSGNIQGYAGLSRGAQQYLAYNFGFKPLIEDMDGAGQFIGYTQFQAKTMRVRVRRKLERDFEAPVSHWQQSGHVTESMQIVAYLTSMPSALDLSGLLDVPSMLWERTSFSFLIDWWARIGPALQAMQMARLLSGTFVQTKVRREETGSFRSGTVYRILGDSSSKSTISVNRTILPSLTARIPNLRPTFHPDTSVQLKHTMEAIALMVVNKKSLVKGMNWLKQASDGVKNRGSYTE
jgi:hypothetical protein